MYNLCRLSKRGGRERGKGSFNFFFLLSSELECVMTSLEWGGFLEDFVKIIKRKSRFLKDRKSQQYTASVCYRSKSCDPFKLRMVSLWWNMAVLDRSKEGWFWVFFLSGILLNPIHSYGTKICWFFGNFGKTVGRNATKSHSTPSPIEPVVLMYFLLGFSQSCGPWKPSKFWRNTEE